MDKPFGYDQTQALGDYRALPAGGYVCRIMGVEETKSKNGNDMLKISLDIAEGEYKNRFADMYRSDTRQDKKWGCAAYQLVYDTTDGRSTNRGFKSFCTAAEESNQGFAIQWGAGFSACFKGRLIGVIFGREEYTGNDGAPHWSTKPKFFRSADKIRKGDFEVPENKPLPDRQTNYSGYPTPAQTADPFAVPPQAVPAAQQKGAPVPGLADFEEIIPDSDLPF